MKPQEKGLMLELMHFPKELVPVEEFNEPAEKAIGKAEMQMAKQLIGSMTSDWDPDQYNDEYRDALEKLIEEKLENPDKAPAPAKKPKATNVIDLVSVLQESLQQSKGKSAAEKKKKPAARKTRKPAKRKKAA